MVVPTLATLTSGFLLGKVSAKNRGWLEEPSTFLQMCLTKIAMVGERLTEASIRGLSTRRTARSTSYRETERQTGNVRPARVDARVGRVSFKRRNVHRQSNNMNTIGPTGFEERSAAQLAPLAARCVGTSRSFPLFKTH